MTKESTLRTNKGLVIYLAQVTCVATEAGRWPSPRWQREAQVVLHCFLLISAYQSLVVVKARCAHLNHKEVLKKKRKRGFLLTRPRKSHSIPGAREREHTGQKPGVLVLFRSKIPWRRKWQPTPVFLPGVSHSPRSLAGYSPWGHKRVGQDLATKQQQQRWGPRFWAHLLLVNLKHQSKNLKSGNRNKKLWSPNGQLRESNQGF